MTEAKHSPTPWFLINAHCVGGPALDSVRAQLPPGLTCIARNHADDAKIVETWI